MPNVNVEFQGQQLIKPGAYYADNVSAALPSTPPTTPPLVFIGYGYGQKPQTAVTFADPQDLLNAIRGGPCSGFVPFLTNPSPQVNGAQIITFINCGENTQASLSLSDAAPSGVAVLTSANYGVPSNLLQAQVANGSLAGKQVTLYDAFSNTSAVGDNLGVPFQIAYTGTASGGVTFTVNTSGLVATSFAAHSPNTGESVTIPIGGGAYSSIEQIVQYLNGTGFYSAVTVGDGTLPATYLDAVSGVALTSPVSGALTYANVTAALGSVLYWVNQYASSFATAAVSGSITQYVSGLAPSNIPFTNFTGATSVPPTNNDYATAFNLALTIPGWAVFADSNGAAVRALLAQHCITASETVNGKWRRGFTGSALGDTVTTTISNAQSLDAIQMSYAYPGIFRTNTVTGQNTLYSGLYAAAAAAGIATGNQVALPLTNKVLVGNGLEVILTDSQINQLQQAGVMCLDVPTNTGVPTIVSDLTTWQIDNNPENVFNQQVACRYYLAYSLVNATQPYAGTIADPIDETRILNAVKQCLNSLIYTPGSNGVLVSWDPKSLQLVYTGATETAAIQVNVVLVGQNRFITIYVPIQPLNITITNAAA